MSDIAEFLTPLRAEQVAPDTWRLLEPLVYHSLVLKTTFEVPSGFASDGDSIPRWLPLVYALLKGKATAPAFVHDWLHQTHRAGTKRVTWTQSDAVLYEAAGASGPGIVPASAWRRWMLWLGVRVGGYGAYRSGPRRYSRLLNYEVEDRRATPRKEGE